MSATTTLDRVPSEQLPRLPEDPPPAAASSPSWRRRVVRIASASWWRRVVRIAAAVLVCLAWAEVLSPAQVVQLGP